MILDVIAVRNKKMKCYANPTFSQEQLKNLEVNMTRSLITSAEMRERYKNTAVYYFGTFDDESGKYDLKEEPEFLFDCDDIIASLPKGGLIYAIC